MTNALRRRVAAGQVTPVEGAAVVAALARLAMARHPAAGRLPRMWALRAVLSAYDATYVALAGALGCPLVTADARLARAPGLRCALALVPR